jgi:hypothetical protein
MFTAEREDDKVKAVRNLMVKTISVIGMFCCCLISITESAADGNVPAGRPVATGTPGDVEKDVKENMDILKTWQSCDCWVQPQRCQLYSA